MQPSEIDKMPFWEYELFIDELNKIVKKENEKQEKETGKYNTDPKSYMGSANKMMNNSMPSVPKMPSMPKY